MQCLERNKKERIGEWNNVSKAAIFMTKPIIAYKNLFSTEKFEF